MSAGVTIYTNEAGSLVLNPRDVAWSEAFADGVQRHLWNRHGDDLVGTPEVEAPCNQITQDWDVRIERAGVTYGSLR